MNRQTLMLALSLLLVSRAALAIERGGIVDSQLTNLQVTKITLQAAEHTVVVTLEETANIVIIPDPAVPYPPPSAPLKSRGGSDGPKPLQQRDSNYKFQLDTENPVDALTLQLLLKAYGTWTPVNLTLDGKGQIATVELNQSTDVPVVNYVPVTQPGPGGAPVTTYVPKWVNGKRK